MAPLKQLSILGLSVILGACGSAEPLDGDPSPTLPGATPSEGSGDGTASPQPGADLTPVGDGGSVGGDGGLGEGLASPGTRRMSLAQLEAAISAVAGNDTSGEPITWTVTFRGRAFDALDENVLGSTLGLPNYVNVTQEDRTPSTLYLKFMDDMVRDVCPKILDADFARGDGEERTLIRYSALDQLEGPEVVETLRYLKLRFHGVRVPEGDDTPIAGLHTLFETVAAGSTFSTETQRAREAWGAVCAGLFLDPAFHIY